MSNKNSNKKQATPVLRSFVQSSLTSFLVKKNDKCLIVVPEDLQITCAVPPSLDQAIGIISQVLNEDEVEVRLKTGDTCIVPLFCICLEYDVIQARSKNQELLLQEQLGYSAMHEQWFAT